MGLAYAILTAIFLKVSLSGTMQIPQIDFGRLQWGPDIEEYFRNSGSVTSVTLIRPAGTTLRVSSDAGSLRRFGASTNLLDSNARRTNND